MTRRRDPRAKSAQPAVAENVRNRQDARWRDHLDGIVSSAFDEVARRRFPAKGRADGIALPYGSAGRLYGAIFDRFARALATDLRDGRPPFVLRVTDEELERYSPSLIQQHRDKQNLKDYAFLLKKAFGASGAIDSDKGSTPALDDRRYRVRFHFRAADSVRFFWLDLWERLGTDETLVFSTPEHGPTRTLSDLLEAGPARFGPADSYSDAQIDGFVAALPPDRQETLLGRIRERLDRIRRALFVPVAFALKTPVGVAVGVTLLTVSVGLLLAKASLPFRTEAPPVTPPPPMRNPSEAARSDSPPPPLPHDVAELILTWPTPSPPQSSRPWNPAVKYPDRFSIGTREDSCNGTIPFVARARAPLLCGRLLSKTPHGYNVAATVAFPISDGSKRYFVRISNRSPSNTWKPSLIEAVIKGDVAAETFVLPIDATGHVWAPIFTELFSVDSKQEVRYEGSELFPLVY